MPVTKGLLQALIERIVANCEVSGLPKSSKMHWTKKSARLVLQMRTQVFCGKLFVIQETVNVLDPVTTWDHIHLCGFAVA
jgi:hypothetical protein